MYDPLFISSSQRKRRADLKQKLEYLAKLEVVEKTKVAIAT